MLWEKTQEQLKATLSANIYALWIEPLTCVEVGDDSVVLMTPDRYFSAYIVQNFLTTIEHSLFQTGQVHRRVRLCEQEQRPTAAPAVKNQLRLPHVPENMSSIRALHPRYTFDEYMVGDSNILAESACRAMSIHDDSVGPCLYLNSATGLGKSHLTQAVAHKIFRDAPMTRLHYVTAQQFASEMIRGIQTQTMDRFKQKYHQHCDILLVEDIHALSGKKKTQEELNQVLDFLIRTGKRVIFTANTAPRELTGIDEEFRSRMTAGLVATIKAPDISTRLRIVEKKAMQHNLCLLPEYIEYIARHIQGDVRQVESALIALRARSRLQGNLINQELLEDVVNAVVGSAQVLTAAIIGELVCRQFRLSLDDLRSRSREKKIAFPRQIAMYLARKHTEESLGEIGKAFNRDHSTVMHAIKTIGTLAVRDTSIGAQLEILSSKLKGV